MCFLFFQRVLCRTRPLGVSVQDFPERKESFVHCYHGNVSNLDIYNRGLLCFKWADIISVHAINKSERPWRFYENYVQIPGISHNQLSESTSGKALYKVMHRDVCWKAACFSLLWTNILYNISNHEFPNKEGVMPSTKNDQLVHHKHGPLFSLIISQCRKSRRCHVRRKWDFCKLTPTNISPQKKLRTSQKTIKGHASPFRERSLVTGYCTETESPE